MEVEWVDSHAAARCYVFAFDAARLLEGAAAAPGWRGLRRCRASSVTALGLPKEDAAHFLGCYAADVSSCAALSAVRTLLKGFGLDPALVTDPEALDVVHLHRWGLLDAAERALEATEDEEAASEAAERAAELEARQLQRSFLAERAAEVCEAAEELTAAMASLVLWRPPAAQSPAAPEVPGDASFAEELRLRLARRAATVAEQERSLRRQAVRWLFGAASHLRAYRKPKMALERRCEYVALVAPQAGLVEFARHFRALAEFNGGCSLGRNFKASVLAAYRLLRGPACLADEPPEALRALQEIACGGADATCAACGALVAEGEAVCSEACEAEVCGRCRSRLATRVAPGTLPAELVPANRARDVEIRNLEYELALHEVEALPPPGCCRLEVLGDCCAACSRWHRRTTHAEELRADMTRRRWSREAALVRLLALRAQPDALAPSVEERYCRRCEAAGGPPQKRPRGAELAPRSSGAPRRGGVW
jgi:hypothetical protein